MGSLTVPGKKPEWDYSLIFCYLRYQDANHAAEINLVWSVGDMSKEILEKLVAHGWYLWAGVCQDGEEGVKELR